jgi:poly(3-hydroxybutyrate) depolymerase
MTRASLFSALLLCLVTTACGDDDGVATPDAGPIRPMDGGTTRDAGSTPDDGGEEHDAGMTMADAGPSIGSAGCMTGGGIEGVEQTFMLDGRERRYLLYLPSGYSQDRAWPLVFALHGNGGSTDYWNGTGGDRNIRGEVEDDAILVIAEAIDGQWRDYGMASDTWPARMELELAYFDAIVERATAELCVNEDAIFSMGFSGGGSFSGVLGCRREYIRAIASGGSVIYFDDADCVSAPAAWTTMGEEELSARGTSFRDYFRDAAGCDTTSEPTDPAPCIAYDGCDPAAPNHYCEHPANHIWPAFGTAAAWQFFGQFVD